MVQTFTVTIQKGGRKLSEIVYFKLFLFGFISYPMCFARKEVVINFISYLTEILVVTLLKHIWYLRYYHNYSSQLAESVEYN